MTLRLIGAGFGRTGTLSLKGALEQIGFGPCYHMLEVVGNEGAADHWYRAACGDAVDWDVVFQGYEATVDWPACNFYRELADQYPDAKVLLSVRDPERWYQSCQDTVFATMKADYSQAPPPMQAQMRMVRKLIVENTFGGDLDDKANVLTVFDRHVEEVKDTIPADRLLVYEVREGWAPLCQFLGVDVPDGRFPRVNTTMEFQARIAEACRAQD
ncbi:MAG: sulfotransferase family protein [Alphaproteobacteria bacterium]